MYVKQGASKWNDWAKYANDEASSLASVPVECECGELLKLRAEIIYTDRESHGIAHGRCGCGRPYAVFPARLTGDLAAIDRRHLEMFYGRLVRVRWRTRAWLTFPTPPQNGLGRSPRPR